MIDLKFELEKLGFIPKRMIENKINRCATQYKPLKKNGWYIFNDEVCNYGSWDDVIESGFFWLNDEIGKLPYAEIEAKRRVRDEEMKKIQAEEYAERIKKVSSYYGDLSPRNVDGHPYLRNKQALPRDDMKFDYAGRLIIPMYDINSQLVGYQYIDDSGIKINGTGSIKKGAFYPIIFDGGTIADLDVIFLCEGYSTGSSVYQALNEEWDAINYGVLCCFGAGNIDVVAKDIVSKYGNKDMVAIKDQDKAGNDVKVVGFTVGFDSGSDANDIHVKYGLDKLTEILVYRMRNIST